jgi:hypothetical protein
VNNEQGSLDLLIDFFYNNINVLTYSCRNLNWTGHKRTLNSSDRLISYGTVFPSHNKTVLASLSEPSAEQFERFFLHISAESPIGVFGLPWREWGQSAISGPWGFYGCLPHRFGAILFSVAQAQRRARTYTCVSCHAHARREREAGTG